MKKLFTGAALAAFARAFVGQPYWYGTYINPCTESRLQGKAKQYPSHYGSSRMPRYRQDIAKGKTSADCVGFDKGAAWGLLGAQAIKYGTNGVPDKSADGMFQWAKDHGAAWGTIKTIPEQPGLAVRFAGHVGTYLGGGKVFEERGFAYGAAITDLNTRPWTHWYERPWVDYSVDPAMPVPTLPADQLGSRLLKNYITGEDVRILQTILVSLGYDIGKDGIDGKYGSDTAKAVKAFQKAEKLKADGEYGEKSHAALMGVLAEHEAAEAEDEIETPMTERYITVTGDTVNVRSGPSTAYEIITRVKKGAKLPRLATAENGWHSTIVNGKTGWISGEYAEIK